MNRKQRVLVCFIHAHIGGAMTSLVNFLNALDTERYDVDVMFYEMDNERYGIKESIRILPQGKIQGSLKLANLAQKMLSPSYMFARVQEQYYRKIKHNRRKGVQIIARQGCRFSRKLDQEYDIAIAYEFNWCMYYVMNQVNAKKKILWNHLEYDKSGLDYQLDRQEFDAADALVFVSDDCRKNFCASHPEHTHKTHYIPNLLPSAYVRSKSNEAVELPFPTSPDQLVFVTVARIYFEHKGFDRAVRSFARLKKDGLLTNVRWLIIGDGADLPQLRSMIEGEGLSDVIYPIGQRSNPIPYLKKCDAFLLPSRHEGKPMAITEGFIMGLVPVVTEYSSAREQIRDGIDGLVFDNNEEALYQGLKKLLSNPSVIKDMQEVICNTDYGNEKEIAAFDRLVDALCK